MTMTLTNECDSRTQPLAAASACANITAQQSNRTSTIGVVLIGGDFQALGVARELAAENIPVFLLQTEPGIARFSRDVSRTVKKFDLLSDPDATCFLNNLADRESLDGWAIFCVNDETVEFLAKNHQELSKRFLVPVPDWEISKHFYNKDLAYQLAQKSGIPVPTIYPSDSLEQLLSCEIRYPIVLKPTYKKNYYDKTHCKAILVRTQCELIKQFNAMLHLIPASQIVAQEFLPGGTKNLYSFAALFDGQRIVSGMSAHRLRQHPMDFGHATTYAESRDMPELELLATRFLAALNYRGVAEVEFMFDEQTGEYKFIEMNGRFWGWHTLTYAAGLNFPMQLYQMMQGIEFERHAPKIGVRWVRLLTDIGTIGRESLRGRMAPVTLFQILMQPKNCAVWSWRDPLPFMIELLMSAYLWWKKGF